MTHGPTYYPSRGLCIYCGATGVPLTDEHIVPLSLGGFHVLRGASCGTCADITKKFEQKIARDLWGDARNAFDAPSRRKKQRPSVIMMTDPTAPDTQIAVPAREYSAGFLFYTMSLAGLLQGLPESEDISDSWQMVIIDDDRRREEFLKKNGGKLVIKFRHVPQDFGRLLIKIAYGQVLTTLDPGDFHPLCLPYILGTRPNVSYLVGSSPRQPVPTPEIGYSLTTGSISIPGTLLLVASVRLYANTHAPEYVVVVGSVTGEREIQIVEGKLAASA